MNNGTAITITGAESNPIKSTWKADFNFKLQNSEL